MRHIVILGVIILLLGGVALSLRGSRSPAREWIEVNLLTVSTKAKQAKYLELAGRHLGEPGIYGQYLRQSEEMAEALLFLDGGQIAVAERFESATRAQEQLLVRERPLPYEALAAAQIENEKMFNYMVKNYQFNAADIKKYQDIVGEHINLIESVIASEAKQSQGSEIAAALIGPRNDKINDLLTEAKKYQAAGLNVEAYEYVKKAKNAVYSGSR